VHSQNFYDISQAGDIGTFERRLISFAYGMEFSLVNAALVVERPGGKPIYQMLGNTPQAFVDATRNVADASRDPVLKRLRAQSIPFLYDQATYAVADAGDLWEEQARFGYATGISVALHLPDNSHFMIGMDRDRPLPRDDAQMTRLLADLQLLAVHSQHAASRLLYPGPGAEGAELPELTKRQIEVLRHAMDGKPTSSIAKAMGVAEGTVNYHIYGALRALKCSTRIQAVLKASQLGLL
jgi:DNA-binding CsgD family transcriptional regulator